MSNFWSAWIIAGSLIVVFGSAYLLRMVIVDKMGEEGKAMPHTFDGIVEMNNPLPRWWTIMFAASIVWGLVYFIFYGLGGYEGLWGWKSANKQVYSLAEAKAANAQSRENNELVQYLNEVDQADAVYGKTYANYAKQPVDALMANEDALQVGQRLFIQNCAQCHGSDARGQRGFPDLTDNDWLYGGSFEKIKETIALGRTSSGMVSWKAALGGDEAVNDVVAYVRSLSGRRVNNKSAAAGKEKFGLCAGCHGIDGTGNQSIGAPNLTDNIWLYGGSQAAITESVALGRAGVMPAWADILGNDKVHILSAYVYSLSNNK